MDTPDTNQSVQHEQVAPKGTTRDVSPIAEGNTRDTASDLDLPPGTDGQHDALQASLQRAQRAMQTAPDDPRVVDVMRQAMLGMLERDACLNYLAEDERRYVVSARPADVVSVLKSREPQEPYPPPKSSEGQRLLRFCLWMLAGLLTAGLATLALCPIVLPRALKLAQAQHDSILEARRAELAFFWATALTTMAVALAALFVLHWTG